MLWPVFLREVVVLWPGFTLRELWEILSCCDLVLLWENFERGCRVVTWFYFERTLRDTVVLWPGFALRELWERLSCCNLVLLWENFERGWTCVEGKCPKVLGLKTFKMVACWLSKWTSTTLSWLGRDTLSWLHKKHRNKILYPLSRPRMQCFYFQITRKIKHVVYITKPFNTIIESEEFLFRASCAPHIDIHLS